MDMIEGLDTTTGFLLGEGFKVICNGFEIEKVADLDKHLLDQQGGELCIYYESKTATIDQSKKTIFLNA
jgi:hypothetical protein